MHAVHPSGGMGCAAQRASVSGIPKAHTTLCKCTDGNNREPTVGRAPLGVVGSDLAPVPADVVRRNAEVAADWPRADADGYGRR